MENSLAKTPQKENPARVIAVIGLIISFISALLTLCSGIFGIFVAFAALLFSGIAFYDQRKKNITDPISILGLLISAVIILLGIVSFFLILALSGFIFFFASIT